MIKEVVYISFILFGSCFADRVKTSVAHKDKPSVVDEIKTIVESSASNCSMTLPYPAEKVTYAPKGPYSDMFQGDIKLWAGTGWGMHDFRINGPIKQLGNNKFIVPLHYSNLTYQYHYKIKISLLNNWGIIKGYVLDLNIPVPVTYSNGKFKLDYVPRVADKYQNGLKFLKGGLLEDTIFNNLPESFHSVIYELLSKVYVKFYCNEALKLWNDAAKELGIQNVSPNKANNKV